jgi:hypothetical protein
MAWEGKFSGNTRPSAALMQTVNENGNESFMGEPGSNEAFMEEPGSNEAFVEEPNNIF